MPGNYSDSFISLPPASGHLTPRQIELAASNETAINEAAINSMVGGSMVGNEEQKVVLDQLKGEASVLNQLRSAGTFVSDLGTKAREGIESMAGRFGQSIPFLSAGAKTPSFSSLLGSAQSSVIGIIGSAFGGKKGLIPDSIMNNLVASKEAKYSARVLKVEIGPDDSADRSHLVSLESIIDKKIVEFLVMPEIVENRTVGYEPVAPTQFLGAFQKYKGTESTQWSINATFISRTSEEATKNLKNLNILRGWTMPFFGKNTASAYPDRIGAPPPVLMLKGLRKAIIGPMPVVITSLSWNWPKDVDYIPATSPDGSMNNVPFPTIMQIAIQCVESLSTAEFNRFNLDDFIKGNMIDSFSKDNDQSIGAGAGRGLTPASAYFMPKVDAQSIGAGAIRGLTPALAHAMPNVISEAKAAAASAADAASRVKTRFVSGGGGDFGGGGAEGDF